MSLPTNISAIIFDCDGVLVDSEALGLDDTVAFLRSQGFEWSAKEVIQQFTGYRDDVFRDILEKAYQNIHGRMPTDALFEGLIQARRRHKDKLKIVPGAEKAVRAVGKAKLPTAVASSSRLVYLERKLKHTGLWDIFDPHVYSAEVVAHGKPAPDIFLYAADKLGVAAENCLVLEDSAQGVKAGLAAGMTVWGFTGGGHCFDGHAENLLDAGAMLVIEGFDELVMAIS